MTVFAEDHTGCISHCIVELVGQCLYVGVFFLYDDKMRKVNTFTDSHLFAHV